MSNDRQKLCFLNIFTTLITSFFLLFFVLNLNVFAQEKFIQTSVEVTSPKKIQGHFCLTEEDLRRINVSLQECADDSHVLTQTVENNPVILATFLIDDKMYTPIPDSKKNTKNGKAFLGSEITLWIKGDNTFALDPADHLLPYINGRPLKGQEVIIERDHKKDAKTYKTTFRLKHTPDSEDNLKDILSEGATFASLTLLDTRSGNNDPYESPITRESQRFTIAFFGEKKATLLVIITAVLAIGILILATTTKLFKEEDRDKWALDRVQSGAWTFIIGLSFVLIWMIKGVLELNNTALLLLGIPVGTQIVSYGITFFNGTGVSGRKQKKGKNPLHGNGSSEPKGLKKFIIDLLKDDNDKYSIFAFQMLVFSCIIWFTYIFTVYFTWSLPVYTGDSEILWVFASTQAIYLAAKYQVHMNK